MIIKEFYPKAVIVSSDIDIRGVKVDVDLNVDFGIQRSLKYKDPGAGNLLSKYTEHLSRFAEAHDFAKKVG
jgi:hypothetical protein